jgi:hypothetical protein
MGRNGEGKSMKRTRERKNKYGKRVGGKKGRNITTTLEKEKLKTQKKRDTEEENLKVGTG